MYKKRIAGLVAGTALAASAVIAPQASAQDPINYCDYDNDHPGVSSVETWLESAPEGANTDCIDVGDIIQSCGFVQIPITDRVIGESTTPPMNYWIEYIEVDTGVTDEQVMPEEGVSFPEGYNGGSVTIEAYIGGPEQDYVKFANEDEWKYPGKPITIDTNCEQPGLPGGGSAGLGSAALGLSALAGSALLSSGGSSAIPDGDGSGPGSADLSSGSSDQDNGNGGDNGAGTGNGGDDSEGPAQGPVDSPDSKATGPVGGQDLKAVAQAQAANAPAAAPAKAAPAAQQAAPAPAAQQAAPAPAAQQQLANTGVQGTLIALAAGLAAIAAGALLVLRRRA